MNKNKFFILAAFGMVVLVTLACGFNVSTANIKNAFMARDSEGKESTKVFAPSDVFYCIVTLANAPEDTKVKAIWYAVEAENTQPNYKIDEYETTSSDATLPFSLTPSGTWPTGKYKVEIYLNGELKQTLEFEVQ
jgi:hypothetical protein